MHDDEILFPRVVARTSDERILLGRLVRDGELISSSLECVDVVDAVVCPRACMNIHPLLHPPDCPVIARTVDERLVKGFFRLDSDKTTRFVDTLDGTRVNLEQLTHVAPALLAATNSSFVDLVDVDHMSEAVSISTDRSLWLVPMPFAEAYVDSWWA